MVRLRVVVVGFLALPSSAVSRFSIAASRFSIDSKPANTFPPLSFSCDALWSAERVAGFFVIFPSASSPTAWICSITDFCFFWAIFNVSCPLSPSGWLTIRERGAHPC